MDNEIGGKIPREIINAHARAHKESRVDDACVTSSAAFTHHIDDEGWLSGLIRAAKPGEIKRGAEKVAKRYGEKVDVIETYLDDLSIPVPDFLRNHWKVWILTFEKGMGGHMFAAIRDDRDTNLDRFFVWDTDTESGGGEFFSRMSARGILERIKHHHQGVGYYYLIGFNKQD